MIGVVALTFLFFAVGAQQWGWDFDKLATLFLIMGLVSGVIGGLGISGTADALVAGARDMTFSALIVGLARGIFVVLDEGHIVDSLVHALVAPLEGLPTTAAALGMFFAQALIHVPVPSTSGQAVLTMPILAPVSDLIGLSRQVTVLAYQLGNGTFDLLFPTNGPLLALLAVSGVRFDDWFKWALPRCLILAAFGCVAVVVGDRDRVALSVGRLMDRRQFLASGTAAAAVASQLGACRPEAPAPGPPRPGPSSISRKRPSPSCRKTCASGSHLGIDHPAVPRPHRRHRSLGALGQLGHRGESRGPRPCRAPRRRAEGRQVARPAPRRADPHQGQHRHRRPDAHQRRVAGPCRHAGAR